MLENQTKISIIYVIMQNKRKLLLHSFCGPCSTSVIEKLKSIYDITVFYYNPNIEPNEEFKKRLKCQKDYIKNHLLDVKLIEGKWENEEFKACVNGLENEPEGGKRCEKCFWLRLRKTAILAKEKGFDEFATTLSVSPHKNAQLINEIGLSLQEEYGVKYLVSDFKKQDGYLKSINLSKKYNLYRQNYCGCEYSNWNLKTKG